MEKACSLFILIVLQLFFLEACIAKSINTDQSALLAFKVSVTFNDSHPLTQNWSSQASVCDWIGVTCGSRHRRVTALNVSNMNIQGTIPQQLGNLSFLVSLDVSKNNLHGDLPQELSRLRKLKVINLGYNNFSGEIPMWFGSFSKLRILILDKNGFTHITPASLSNLSKLETLSAGRNHLHGSTFLKGIGNLQSFKELVLYDNQLTGTIPLEIVNFERLELLDLGGNNLQGTIPHTISNMSSLREILLNNNNLTGTIPEKIGSLRNLQRLRLENNHIVGSIPRTISNMSSLRVLVSDTNNLTEYGSEGLVSTSCDVYSYGIMLMETFTRKRPYDDMFQENLSMKSWVCNSLQAASVEDIIDATLLRQEEINFRKTLHCVSSILELALNCTVETPNERLNIKDILANITKIKLNILANDISRFMLFNKADMSFSCVFSAHSCDVVCFNYEL